MAKQQSSSSKNLIRKAMKNLTSLRSKIESANAQVVSAIFSHCSNIEKFKVVMALEDDGYSVYDVLELVSINGIEWDTEIFSPDLDQVGEIEEESEDLRGWLIEANLTSQEFSSFVEAIKAVEKTYLKEREYKEFHRSKFL